MTSVLPLDELHTHASAMAAELPRAARMLAARSVDRLIGALPSIGQTVALGNVSIGWRFFLAKSGERIVFFFFKRESPVEVILHADLNVRFSPDFESAPVPPLAPGRATYEFVLPAFVVARPTPAELERFGPAPPPRATRRNTLILAVGPARRDRLAIRLQKNARRMRYTEGGVPQELPLDNDVRRGWPLAPFAALLTSIRSWIDSDPTAGPTMRVEPPAPETQSEPWRILRQLVATFCSAQRGPRERNSPGAFQEALLNDFVATGVDGSVLLRLNPDGSLANRDRRSSKVTPFQLDMRVAIARRGGRPRVRVSIAPPDFLVGGALFGALLEALRRRTEELAGKLGVPAADAERFLGSLGRESAIFRVGRKGARDTELYFLRGTLQRKPVTALVRAQVRVFPAETPPRAVLRRNSIEKLYCGPPDAPNARIDRDTVDYFVRLAKYIRDWLGVIV